MASFTKKHFIKVAETLKASKPRYSSDTPEAMGQWEYSVACMADLFAGENELFDRKRFLDACTFP